MTNKEITKTLSTLVYNFLDNSFSIKVVKNFSLDKEGNEISIKMLYREAKSYRREREIIYRFNFGTSTLSVEENNQTKSEIITIPPTEKEFKDTIKLRKVFIPVAKENEL